MQGGARAGDHTFCKAQTHGVPHEGGPLRITSHVCLLSDGKPIVRLGDHAMCRPGTDDVVVEGAATFTVCGVPVARTGDGTYHGGSIVEGSPHFEIGGPTFKLPKNIFVHGTPDFVDKTLRDFYLLSTTKTGKALLDRLEKANKPLDIRWTDDDNGHTIADDGDLVAPQGSRVLYNPEFRGVGEDADGDPIDCPPTEVLAHELVHALDNAEGRNTDGVDERRPDIDEEEARAIGVGTHAHDFPTENSLRDELGWARRDNHDLAFVWGDGPPRHDLRPGHC